jgi:hypothetical protein
MAAESARLVPTSLLIASYLQLNKAFTTELTRCCI